MIYFFYETDFKIENEIEIFNWISDIVRKEKGTVKEINFIFCNDEYLHKINLEYLNHDTYTDIISFDYSVGRELYGDIFISVERVRENAKIFLESFDLEFFRVISHGVLHLLGYKDKEVKDKEVMKIKEDKYIEMNYLCKFINKCFTRNID